MSTFVVWPTKKRGPKEGRSGRLYLFILIYLLVVWILSSQEGKGNVFKEKRERDPALTQRSELGLWVDSQPNQLVVCSVPHMQFPLSQPPQIPHLPTPKPNVSLSLLLSVGLNIMEFNDIYQQCRTEMWTHCVWECYPTRSSFFLSQNRSGLLWMTWDLL